MRLTPSPANPPDTLLGRVIAGKFAIQARLGAGAMGIVYRARQLALERTVALKVLHREVAVDADFADRFWREARAASRLDHPNSIRVFDFGEEPDGLLYLAMEYVEGCDLFEWVSRHGAPSANTIVEILAQVLAALAVAHEMAVVHRDLKPENILIVRGVSDEGDALDMVKVCDFGIAKMLDLAVVAERAPRQNHSTPGLIVGTPAYMSPEQARGETLDARSDLYSVGIVLYELLTRRVPFEGETPLAVALKQVSDAPEPPSSLVSDVDPTLAAICMKALHKSPKDRYQSAREMRLALLNASGAAQPLGRSGWPKAPASLTPEPRARRDSSGPTRVIAAPALRSRRTLSAVAALLLVLCLLVLLTARSSWLPQHDVRAAVPRATLAPRASAQWASSGAAASPLTLPADPISTFRPSRVGEPLDRAKLSTRTADPRAAHEKLPTAPSAERQVHAPSIAAAPLAPQSVSPEPAMPQVQVQVASSAFIPLAPAPDSVPAYDLNTARVAIGTARNVVGATAASVTRAVAEAAPRITACYRSALPNLSGSLEGLALLHIDTDGDGTITDALLNGPLHGNVASCVASAVHGHRIAHVDTGSASADVPLSFRAH